MRFPLRISLEGGRDVGAFGDMTAPFGVILRDFSVQCTPHYVKCRRQLWLATLNSRSLLSHDEAGGHDTLTRFVAQKLSRHT
jgi:hypothetical protein